MIDQLRCPACNSTMTYVRLTTGEIVCRKCATITPKLEHPANPSPTR